jgi:hypothetical protein
MAASTKEVRIPLDAPLARPDRIQAFEPGSPTPIGAEVCEPSARGTRAGRAAPADPDRIRAPQSGAAIAARMHAARAERIDAAGERAADQRAARREKREARRRAS